ncbi:hypothetical protein EGW08_017308 [Elysia chlorotica]|uniref:Secreted protein n=1 Tax=Elysia chlorotica TaxID=188477 RepID=A0A3S0ZTI4_ELYCH|nr:hypothetical protein EGW08_017308 [Elysia chlorotica]
MKWLILTAVLAVAAAKHFHTCPSNIRKAIHKCMRQVPTLAGHGGRDPSMHQLMSDLQKTVALCSEDTLPNLFDCLNELYNECARKRENAKKLGLVINAKQWESAVDLLCKNQGYLRNNLQCEARAMPEFNPCIQQVMGEIKGQIDALNQDYTLMPEARMAARTDLGCLLQVKIEDCLKKPFDKHCSPYITNLLLEVLRKFTPPTCTQRDSVYSPWDETAQGQGHTEQGENGAERDTSKGGHSVPDKVYTNPKEIVHLPEASVGQDNDGDNHDDVDKDDGYEVIRDDDKDDHKDIIFGDESSRSGDSENRRQSIFKGPDAAAAQAKDSDKDGGARLETGAVKFGVLMSVVITTVTLATIGRA